MSRLASRFALVLGSALLFAAVGAACGDDEPSTDESFARDLCEAARALDASLAAAIADANSATDPDKAVELLAEPLDEFVDAFGDADPPAELQSWHRDASGQLRDAVAKFKTEKTLASLEGFGDSPVPDPPADAKQRLREAAESVEECEGVAFLKPD